MSKPKRSTGRGRSLIPADRESELRALYFERGLSASDLAAYMELEPKQVHDWLNRKGWPAERRAVLGFVSQETERTAERLVNARSAARERIADAAVREAEKETEALARTQNPGKRLVIARTLSTLLASMRTAEGEQRTAGASFPFDFRSRWHAMKRAQPVAERVRPEVRPELPPGESD